MEKLPTIDYRPSPPITPRSPNTPRTPRTPKSPTRSTITLEPTDYKHLQLERRKIRSALRRNAQLRPVSNVHQNNNFVDPNIDVEKWFHKAVEKCNKRIIAIVSSLIISGLVISIIVTLVTMTSNDTETSTDSSLAFLVGNGVCDDVTNTNVFQFDGGDCCLQNVIPGNCSLCMCYETGLGWVESRSGSTSTTSTTSTTITTTSTGTSTTVNTTITTTLPTTSKYISTMIIL